MEAVVGGMRGEDAKIGDAPTRASWWRAESRQMGHSARRRREEYLLAGGRSLRGRQQCAPLRPLEWHPHRRGGGSLRVVVAAQSAGVGPGGSAARWNCPTWRSRNSRRRRYPGDLLPRCPVARSVRPGTHAHLRRLAGGAWRSCSSNVAARAGLGRGALAGGRCARGGADPIVRQARRLRHRSRCTRRAGRRWVRTGDRLLVRDHGADRRWMRIRRAGSGRLGNGSDQRAAGARARRWRRGWIPGWGGVWEE